MDYFTGNTTQKPSLQVSNKLDKFVLSGTLFNGGYLYKVGIVDYNNFYYNLTALPTGISAFKVNLILGEYHLYAINVTAVKSQYFYTYYYFSKFALISIYTGYLTEA
jgi:hypothetical protein